MARLGVSFELDLVMAGFYPQGGGVVHAALPGNASFSGLSLCERGRLQRVCGLSAVANLAWEIGECQRKAAMQRLHASWMRY